MQEIPWDSQAKKTRDKDIVFIDFWEIQFVPAKITYGLDTCSSIFSRLFFKYIFLDFFSSSSFSDTLIPEWEEGKRDEYFGKREGEIEGDRDG